MPSLLGAAVLLHRSKAPLTYGGTVYGTGPCKWLQGPVAEIYSAREQRSALLVSTLDKCPEQSVLHIDQPNQANYQGPAALGKGNSMEKLVCDYILLGMVFHKGPCQVC